MNHTDDFSENNLTDLSVWGTVEILTVNEAALLWGGIDPTFCASFDDATRSHYRMYQQAYVARKAFISGLSLGTLPANELWCVDYNGESYKYVDKNLPSINDICPIYTTINMLALRNWAEKKRVKTLRQNIKEQRRERMKSNDIDSIEVVIRENHHAVDVLSLPYMPKYDTPAYNVIVKIIREYYDTVPEGGTPLKQEFIRLKIAEEWESITGVKPSQNVVNSIDRMARADRFK